MYISKILAALAALITLLYSWFPNSDFIADLYFDIQAGEFGWVELSDTLEESIEEKDAHTLSLMASQKLKENHSDLEQDIQKLLNSLEGDILSVENNSHFEEMIYRDFHFNVTTTTDFYAVVIHYEAVGPDDSVLGIRRIMLMIKTDEHHSWWTDPENYISEGIYEDYETNYARSWQCGKGNMADEYVFMVNKDCSRLTGDKNVEIRASRNGGDDAVPSSGFAFQEDDVLKVHLIPEGEEPPAHGTREPDAIITAKNRHPECYVKPGRYYLYVEPSDEYIIYSVSVITKL